MSPLCSTFTQTHVIVLYFHHDPRLGQKIMDALQATEVIPHNEYTTKSRSYRLGVAHNNMQASVQGSVIFDPSSQLPREVLLETTLEAFGFSMDIWEVGNSGDHNNQPFVIQKETILIYVSTLIPMCCV